MFDELKKEKNVPVVIASQDGNIIYVNKKFEDVFKWSSGEIIGKPLTVIIPNHLHDAHNLGFSRFLTTQKSVILDQSLSLEAINKKGDIFKAEHVIRAEKSDGSWVFAATIKPL